MAQRSRSDEFTDALSAAREGVLAHLERHKTEIEPEHLETIVQRHAEQIRGIRAAVKMKEERGRT